jgi:hypothetical protein
MKLIGSDYERKLNTILMDYLPRYYQDSKAMMEIMKIDAAELESLNAATLDVFDQFFINKATWGLDNWEKILNITPSDRSYAQRRSVIISRLRGTGVVTAALIKNVAESFLNGEVQVTEVFSNYEILVKFIGTRGIPDDLEGLRKSIRDIVPAHLGIQFIITYLAFIELDNQIWRDIDLLTWSELETKFF